MRGSALPFRTSKSNAKYTRLLRGVSSSENLLRISLGNLGSRNAIKRTFELLEGLLVAFRDIIVLDPALAYREKAPERLSRSVMSCFMACLKLDETKYGNEIEFMLDEIMSHYQLLLLSLHGKIEDMYKATAENFKSYIDNLNSTHLGPALRLIHDCFIFIGDISKVVAVSGKFDKEKSKLFCDLAIKNYLKAWIVYYGSAIPSALIASVSRTINNDIDALYWFTLSLGTSFTPQWAKNELVLFLKDKVHSGNEDSTPEYPVLYDVMDFTLSLINAVEKQEANYIDTLLEICDRLSPKFFKCLSEQTISACESQEELLCKETKIIGIMCCLFCYLSKIFSKSDHPSKRQRIRLTQVIITLELILLSGYMLSLVCPRSSEHLSDDEEDSISQTTLSIVQESLLWEPISLACFCLSIDNSQMKIFKEYSKELTHSSKRISKTMADFCWVLSRVANELIHNHDISKTQEFVPEDVITLGLKQTSVHYKEYSAESLRQFLEHPYAINEHTFSVRISRIISLAKSISELFPDVLVLSKDGGCEKFVVYDERKKEIKAKKLMKALAAERLRDQVKSLKGLYKRIKPNVPTAILAADCYLNNINLVKKWVNTKSCTVIVPQCVIGDLDFLGKLGPVESTISKEASRYLETMMRRKSEYIKPQRSEEQCVVWDNKGRVHNSNTVVPRSLMELMSVSLYYRDMISYIPGSEKREAFVIVTDSKQIIETARSLKISTYRPKEWSRYLDKISHSHSRRMNSPNLKKDYPRREHP